VPIRRAGACAVPFSVTIEFLIGGDSIIPVDEGSLDDG
jgi:hypothetical protein